MPFAAVRRSLLAHRVIRGASAIWSLTEHSGQRPVFIPDGQFSVRVITRLPSRIMNSQSSAPRRKGAFAEEAPPRCIRRTPVIWRGVCSY
jgi:hypothetical protein